MAAEPSYNLKKLLAVVAVILAIIVIVILYWRNQDLDTIQDHPEDEFHIHASFLLYQDGTLLDFSAPNYMHFKPCTGNEDEELTALQKQQEKIHLHNQVGDVAHVHEAGTTWRDLFTNLNIELSDKVRAYSDSQLIEDPLNLEVSEYARMLFVDDQEILTFEIEDLFDQVPSKAEIIAVENDLENCGK